MFSPQRPSPSAYILQRTQSLVTPTLIDLAVDPVFIARPPQLPVRNHLERWQGQYGGPSEETLSAFEKHPLAGEIVNNVSKVSNASAADVETEGDRWFAGEDDDGEDLVTIGLFLKPGDVVELSQSGREPILAVFVQQLDNDSQFYTINGKWAHSNLGQISFAIPGCVDPMLLQPIIPFLPTDPDKANPKGEVHVPPEIAAPVQGLLDDLAAHSEAVYRQNAPVLDTAYAVLADNSRTRMMTLAQIAKALLGRGDTAWQPSSSDLLAVRKALNHNAFRFRSDQRSHRLTNVFAIRPKKDVEIVETVHEWIREYFEYRAKTANDSQKDVLRQKGAENIFRFLQKARRLIAKSRKYRDPASGGVGPNKNRDADALTPTPRIVTDEAFTKTDNEIITFLQAWVLNNQFQNMSGLHSACTDLVAATGLYQPGVIQHSAENESQADLVRRATGLVFLQEIGVVTPYENRSIYDEQLMLPTVRLSRNLEVLNEKAKLLQITPDFRDSMARTRRDWGDTSIYCIDDLGAQEIDDGISIENVDGAGSEFWVHVHVANPTAFFDKTHTLSSLAAHMTQTVYTPEQTFPMLPKWATEDHFSLQRDRPVITFSSRVDRQGDVLETKISHGIIRNPVSITPSELALSLGEKAEGERRRLIVGGNATTGGETRLPPSIKSTQVEELRNLYLVARRLSKKRQERGGISMFNSSPSVRVFESDNKPGLTWNPPSTEKSRFIKGDPIIKISKAAPKGFLRFDMDATNIVEEIMMLGCTAAATWCGERGIPVMFRGSIAPPNVNRAPSEELKHDIMTNYLAKHRNPPLRLTMQYMESLGRAIAHTSPLPHRVIGVSGYVRVTSPLRRFSDMVAHWQIEAAMRYEQKTGKMFNAAQVGVQKGALPFSQRQIQESIITLSPREKLIATTQRNAVNHWVSQAFLRALHYGEAELPSTFKCWIRYIDLGGNRPGSKPMAAGLMPEFGLRVAIRDMEDAQLGDEWEVALDSVDLFNARIYVKPVRLLKREMTDTE
ncbi:RNB-domain-containing protein [Didymella exigua CBS 183.55]|uniref:RNB-domain-containing protein n=1 Tax=Didymella exigua CBS 183.55 TaxID=1150837 RepID=A0A6A5RWC6_9PLEO|nr:RNB-domain-containing protein [Didymella exigua CBS 183.55]KAF1930596.1 RNB-domain-containing protein [Didymella exigua CBS 183.55]